jgi:pimeloyl-ACP methyl ester carboxylesterase/uncharacterized protein (DUF952 family)
MRPDEATGEAEGRTTIDGVTIEHRRVRLDTTGVDGPLELHVAVAGPPDGAPVILLHGFPELWWSWRHQVAALAKAGYRAIAPDQRGYTTSDKPRPVAAYAARHLVRDVVALQDALCGGAPTHVVGHDWGGAVAWSLAMARPERVRTLTVVNCPRPSVIRRALLTSPRQLARSWYMAFFQLPRLPERFLVRGGVARALAGSSAPGTFSADDLARYQAVATPEAMRGAVSWYRAAARHGGPDGPVTAPTLLLWGTADHALGEELADASVAGLPDARLVKLPGVSHWAQNEAHAEVTAHLLDHLGAHGGPDPLVYKLVGGATWASAPDPWPGSPDDLRDGFVHLSARHQVEGTLRKHFVGVPDLRLLAVDPARLPAGALRWEVSRGGARFPHLHGPLPRAAVVRETPLEAEAPALPR